VQQIGGAIGYVEYAYVIENHLTFTNMMAAGKQVAPTMDAFQAAAANADFTKAKDFYLILTNQPGDKSWPIIAATYMLLRKDSPVDQNRLALKPAKALEYVPLPDAVVKEIETYWSRELGGAWEMASH
jgi:phosphate transport system substrate-binding protein